jgi:hypothetical protein
VSPLHAEALEAISLAFVQQHLNAVQIAHSESPFVPRIQAWDASGVRVNRSVHL